MIDMDRMLDMPESRATRAQASFYSTLTTLLILTWLLWVIPVTLMIWQSAV